MKVMVSENGGANWVLQVFILLYFFSAMGAYSLFGVPVPWLSLIGISALAVWIVSRGRVPSFPGMTLLLTFVCWAIFITVVNMVVSDASALMPPKATTGYLPYVGLRVITMLAFASVIVCGSWLLNKGKGEKIIEAISTVGVIISAYAIYVYLAQVYGWPEIPRTRAGTDGKEQSVIFSYAFHRAMGSFREPSHLAEWLVVPFIINFISRKQTVLKALIMASVLLLTGSLTGFIGIGGGFAIAGILSIGHWSRVGGQLVKVLFPIALAGLVFTTLVSANEKSYSGFLDVMWSRLEPLFNEGVQGTDRAYVYKYVDKHPPSLLGEGLGNANLRFGKDQRLDATASFLNLYINILYSLGYAGLGLLIWFIISPILFIAFKNHASQSADFYFVLSAYFAWVIIFFSHAEELSYQFGISYALLVFMIKNKSSPVSADSLT